MSINFPVIISLNVITFVTQVPLLARVGNAIASSTARVVAKANPAQVLVAIISITNPALVLVPITSKANPALVLVHITSIANPALVEYLAAI